MSNETTKAAKAPNYTEAMVETMTTMYAELGNDGLEQIAETIGRSKRSVISKLVREGVYAATVKAAATPKDTGPTKKELLRELESLSFSPEGFDNASKSAIQRLIAFVQDAQAEEEALADEEIAIED